MIISFVSGLISIIVGVLILLNTSYGILNGFGVAHTFGIIQSLQISDASFMMILLKIGIILSFFIMPITVGTSLIILVVTKLILR